MNFKKLIQFAKSNIELMVWTFGLIALAFTNPDIQHWTLCPLENMGFNYCPGCGLGHSITYLFRGEWAKSFQTHPLGGIAVIILLYRIYSLSQLSLSQYLNQRHQS